LYYTVQQGNMAILLHTAVRRTFGMPTSPLGTRTIYGSPNEDLAENLIADTEHHPTETTSYGTLRSASRSFGAILGGLLISETSIHTAILVSMIFPAMSIVLTIPALEE